MHEWGFRYWILPFITIIIQICESLIVVMLILSHRLLHLSLWCSLTLPLTAGEKLTFKYVEFWSANQHFSILIHSAIHSPDKTLSITGHCNLSCALYLDLLRLVRERPLRLRARKYIWLRKRDERLERDGEWKHKWGERNMWRMGCTTVVQKPTIVKMLALRYANFTGLCL